MNTDHKPRPPLPADLRARLRETCREEIGRLAERPSIARVTAEASG